MTICREREESVNSVFCSKNAKNWKNYVLKLVLTESYATRAIEVQVFAIRATEVHVFATKTVFLALLRGRS